MNAAPPQDPRHLPTVRRLPAIDAHAIDALADVLIDCVEGGASVSFMSPLDRERARSFWLRVAQDVAALAAWIEAFEPAAYGLEIDCEVPV